MPDDDVPLRIIAIELPDEAMKSYRLLNGLNPDLYPVIVGFSRGVDEYERLALKDFGVTLEDRDNVWALIENTTIEAISDHIDEYNAELDKAVEAARQMRQDAEAEDQRIQDRARTLWNKLREDYGLPPLP